MKELKKNLQRLLNNSRSRLLIIIISFVLLGGLLYAIVSFFNSSVESFGEANSRITVAPDIRSIPGSVNPTAQYAKLQEQENANKVKVAERTGRSAIPTIIRTEKFGEGSVPIAEENNTAGVGFAKLALNNNPNSLQSLLNALQLSNCARSDLEKAKTKGAALDQLLSVCSCVQLQSYSIPTKELLTGCSCETLREGGASALELAEGGLSARKLRTCGFSACEMKAAGFTAAQMKAAGFTDGELKGAGFSPMDIKAASGLPGNMTIDDVKKAGCKIRELAALREQGVTSEVIRKASGCSLASLKAAGYTANELKEAGFSAAELKAAGYSAAELKAAGYSAKQLKQAGFSATELKAVGFSAKQLKQAGFSTKQLKQAGFTDQELLRAGFTKKDIKRANEGLNNCSIASIKKHLSNKLSVADIRKKYNCNAKELLKAGINASQLLGAGYSADNVTNAFLDNGNCSVEFIIKAKQQGVSAEEIRDTLGCSVDALADAGYSVQDLKQAGFSAAELKVAGFSAADLKAAGFNANELEDAGFTVAELQSAGFTAKELLASGFSAEELRQAGFSADELKQAGFSAEELRQAGFSAKELKQAGFSATELKTAGFSPEDLVKAGFSAKELKQAGFSATELKAAGISAKELKSAGFNAAQLKAAGFNANELKIAGFNASELKASGFSVDELIEAAYSDSELSSAGFTKQQIQNAKSSIKSNDDFSFIQDEKVKQALIANKNKQLKVETANRIREMTSLMQSHASSLAIEWTPSEQQFVNEQEDDDGTGLGIGVLPGNRQNTRSPAESEKTITKPAMIKAGDVLFAVLETSINTDEPGPILARISQGKFKGAKIIGTVELPNRGQKAILKFNTMSLPGADNTIAISSVAIDINTARTAISSRTDNHYVQRYGSLLASSFLEGFGQSFGQKTTTTDASGAKTEVISPGEDIKNNAYVGLGNLGTKWSEALGEYVNRSPTVFVYSGVGLGLLFLQDVASIE